MKSTVFQDQPKLISAGCSFSDYLQNNRTVYGLELAGKLGRSYDHQGAGAGSNWRMWRVLSTKIIRGEITNRDLVTVQYTGLERREFWSSHQTAYHPDQNDILLQHRDQYADGELIRYKANAWQWQDHRRENKFLKLYEQHHVCLEYEQEWFDIQHHQFQLLLQHYNIPCIFIVCRHRSPENFELMPHCDRLKFAEPLDFQKDAQTWYHSTDNSHLCDQGHQQLAQMLYDHIRQLGL